VTYTVWSRGRLIGETDLGFTRVFKRFRSGWFHPNTESERSMSVIASVLPAMQAYLLRDTVDAQGHSPVKPALHGSEQFADLAEAFQHLLSLDLELRGEDGCVVPTSDIGIQDTQQLREFFPVDLDDIDGCDPSADDEIFEATDGDLEFDADVRSDAELIEQALDSRFDDLVTEWTPDDLEEPPLPRYQIHVLLLEDDGIP
jgi:hypothetical protein